MSATILALLQSVSYPSCPAYHPVLSLYWIWGFCLISHFLPPQSLVQIRTLLKCLNLHVYPLLLPSLTSSTCPCPKGMYQLIGKLPLLFPFLSAHLTWTIPQINDPFPYSLFFASSKTCSLSPLRILSLTQPYLHYSIRLSITSVHFIRPSLCKPLFSLSSSN